MATVSFNLRSQIPAEYFGLVTSYLADSKGGVRDVSGHPLFSRIITYSTITHRICSRRAENMSLLHQKHRQRPLLMQQMHRPQKKQQPHQSLENGPNSCWTLSCQVRPTTQKMYKFKLTTCYSARFGDIKIHATITVIQINNLCKMR